ncbi:YkuJ family protein [Lactovum odontotermitis]
MKSHLITILDRLDKLVEEDNPKATYNFEREGAIKMTVSFNSEDNMFIVKYPKQKTPVEFDSIDLVAIEAFETVFDN